MADLLGSALNRYVTIHEAAPALAAIEHECVAWMCREIVGYGRDEDAATAGDRHEDAATAGGVLTSGGSIANLLAVHAARRKALGNDRLADGTLYVSEQAHYCVEQAARFVGLQPKHVRSVSDRPCNVRREGGKSLVIGGPSLVMSEGKACNPL